MSTEIMIDIETLGTQPGAVILEIGVVAFQGIRIVATEQIEIDTSASYNMGFTADDSTLKWWEQRGGAPTPTSPVTPHQAVQALSRFMFFWRNTGAEMTKIWTRGNFDIPLVAEYYKRTETEVPWKYWEIRDQRTALCELAGEQPPKTDVPHRALLDAIMQAEQLISARHKVLRRTIEE